MSVLSAVEDGLHIAKTVVDIVAQPIKSAQLNKPTNEQHERLQAFQALLNNPNDGLRGIQLAAFCDQLCADANLSIGLLSGRTVRVPVEHLTAFIAGVGQLIQTREQVAAQATSTNKTL